MKELREFRKKWKLSADELAKKIKVSRMTIYRWENAKHTPHGNHYEKLLRLMRKYNK